VVRYKVNLPTTATGSVGYSNAGALTAGADYTISERTATGFKLTINDSALRDAAGNHYMLYVTFRTELTANQPAWKNDASFSEGVPVSALVNRPGSVTGDITDPRIYKSGSLVSTNEKTIAWTVSLNPVSRSLKDVIIADTFGSSPVGFPMTLLNDSTYPFTVKLGSTTLKEGVDYYITVTGTTGFIVEFREDLAVNGQLLVMTYTTRYDLGFPNASGQFNNGNPISYSNGVSAEAELINDSSGGESDVVSPGGMADDFSSRGVSGRDSSRVPIASHSASVTLNALTYRNAAKSGSFSDGKFN